MLTPTRPPLRPAFTMVELLVVIAIIGMLVSLLLPAVQSARESSRRTSCTNNMRQLGIAFQVHHDHERSFPPGGIGPTDPPSAAHQQYSLPQTAYYGWMPFLLSEIEQQNLESQFDKNLHFSAAPNSSVSKIELPILLCPTTPSGARTYSTNYKKIPVTPACTDYIASSSISSTLWGTGIVKNWTMYSDFYTMSGLMLQYTTRTMPACLDGTSNTLLVVESAGRPIRYAKGGRPAANTFRPFGSAWADLPLLVLEGSDDSGNLSVGPYAVNRINNGQIYAFHPAGANAVMADGSVRFLHKELRTQMVADLISVAGGE